MGDIYTIVIPKLQVFGYHGCYDQEKNEGQKFEVNMEICIELDSINQYNFLTKESDNINNTLDYSEIENAIKESFRVERFDLLETLAAHLSNIPYELASKEMSKSILSVEVIIRKNNPIGMSVPYIELKYVKMNERLYDNKEFISNNKAYNA